MRWCFPVSCTPTPSWINPDDKKSQTTKKSYKHMEHMTLLTYSRFQINTVHINNMSFGTWQVNRKPLYGNYLFMWHWTTALFGEACRCESFVRPLSDYIKWINWKNSLQSRDDWSSNVRNSFISFRKLMFFLT